MCRASIAFILAFLPLFAFAQTDPLPAPAEVTLQFKIENDRQQFHLGELIPISVSYSAVTPGKYYWLERNERLIGGRGLKVSCSPAADEIDLNPLWNESVKLAEMLSTCGGVGRGRAGGCGDCEGEISLDTEGLSFGPTPLNYLTRFSRPGTYTCRASAADITAVGNAEPRRQALLVASNPVVLTLIQDAEWEHSALTSYASQYDKLCRNDASAMSDGACDDLAQRITYLDTAESLALEIKTIDGRSHRWENGFWTAIERSSYPQQRLRWMTQRFQDPDFEVSQSTIESLVLWQLAIDFPGVFQSAPKPSHHLAIEEMRKFVRLLGDSLKGKNANVLKETTSTYQNLANGYFCEPETLIPAEE
jgi:hypothetical protein